MTGTYTNAQEVESILIPGLSSPISRLGLGGCPLGGHGWGAFDETAAVESVKQAMNLGISLFDTADIYGLGRSEKLLASALGANRHRVCITTKGGVRRTADGRTFYDTSPKWLRYALEASLRRLQVDYIPLYYIHWPDDKTPIAESVAELEKCRAAGKIGAVGLCNTNHKQLSEASAVTQIAAVQVCYNLIDRVSAESLLPLARQLSIPLITWGSLAQGMLGGRMAENTKFRSDDRRSRYKNYQGNRYLKNLAFVSKLKNLANRIGRTPAQVAVRWLLDQPGVGSVLFGAKNVEQVNENFGSLDWALDLSTRRFLDNATAIVSN